MNSIMIAEAITGSFLLVSLIGQFFEKEKTLSLRWLQSVSIANLLFLCSDFAAYFLDFEQVSAPLAVMHVVNLLAFTMGSVVLIFHMGYCKAYIRELAPLAKWVFRVPAAVMAVVTLVIAGRYLAGGFVVIENGVARDVGSFPPVISAIQFLVLAYPAVVAFAMRRAIGLDSAVLFTLYGLCPIASIVVTALTGQDYAAVASVISVVMISTRMQRYLEDVRAKRLNTWLRTSGEHEKLRADALDFIQKTPDLEPFIEFLSERLLGLYGCDQVLYRDEEGRLILKERPGTPKLDFSLCTACPHYAFDARVYSDGFTVMDDCRVGYRGIPVHRDCRVRASLTWLVHDKDRPFGYIALHYLGGPHHFTEDEKRTFDGVAKLLEMVLVRRRHRKEIDDSLAFTNYFVETFVSTYSVNLETRVFKVYRRTKKLDENFPVIPDYLESLQNYSESSVHPDDRTMFMEFARPGNLKKLLADRTMVSLRYREISEKTERVYRFRVIRGADENNVVFAFGDITDEVGREQGRLKDNCLRDFSSMVNAAVWSVDLGDDDRPIRVTWSEEFRRMLGIDREESAGHALDAWAERLHPEDLERVLAHYRESVASRVDGLVCNIAFRIRRRGGEYGWCHAYGRMERADGGVRRLYGIIADISAEKKVEEQQRLLEEALSQSRAANAKLTEQKNFLDYFMKSYASAYSVDLREDVFEILHLEPGSPIAFRPEEGREGVVRFISEHVHPDDRELMLRMIDREYVAERLRKEEFFNFTMRLVDGDRMSTMRGLIVRGIDEYHVAVGFLDITGEIRAEEERQRQVQENLAAERANKAKSYFFSMVSHDIRTPLNAIIGYAELLKLGIADETERATAIDSVLVSGHTLLELINDVLDLSKLEAGKMEIVLESVDVLRLIKEVAKSFRATIGQKPVEIRTVMTAMPWLKLDPHRIRQILFNLVGNAVKFTEKGFVEIAASYEQGSFRFEVRDTGCGISEEDQKRIAQPYVQVGSSENRGKGTGLGLAICRQLVARMGGEIELASALGRGTTFTVIIPCTAEEDEQRRTRLSTTQRIRMAVEGRSAAAYRRVLVVDDQSMNRMVMKTMLMRLGIRDVVLAENGLDALEKLKKEESGSGKGFDLVLTDMWMPQMDGEGLVRAIRGNPVWANLPVYAVTADVAARKAFATMGFTDVILKPLTLVKLKELLG